MRLPGKRLQKHILNKRTLNFTLFFEFLLTIFNSMLFPYFVNSKTSKMLNFSGVTYVRYQGSW